MINWMIITGDCLETLRGMPAASIDAVATDPPYGLGKEPDPIAMLRDWLTTGLHSVKGSGFMGKAWDACVPQPQLWAECLRVLKPGGHLLAFGGTRTVDLVTLGIRIAGFEIRDSLHWIYGSGFPKSLCVIEASIGEYRGANRERWRWFMRQRGLGTALKPAHEPIVVARKPLSGTVAATVLEHGTGGINVDACRVASGPDHAAKCASVVGIDSNRTAGTYGEWKGKREDSHHDAGRWPPNLLLTHTPECGETCADDCPVREMGKQSGETTTPGSLVRNNAERSGKYGIYGDRAPPQTAGFNATGTAARFFPCFRYVAKPSRAERDAGITREPVSGGEATDRKDGSAGLDNPRTGAGRQGGSRNIHATVKPIALMRWLIRLVTPPCGTVLDPFAGSGTTGAAAALEGFDFIGCELSEEYSEIARERIAFWENVDPDFETIPMAQESDDRQGLLFEAIS